MIHVIRVIFLMSEDRSGDGSGDRSGDGSGDGNGDECKEDSSGNRVKYGNEYSRGVAVYIKQI